MASSRQTRGGSGARSGSAATTESLGFLLAKASARWNERLAHGFAERGFPEVRPAWGSVLLPLYEEDGLRMGELARRSRLAKQTLTTPVPPLERGGLIVPERDPGEAPAARAEGRDGAVTPNDEEE